MMRSIVRAAGAVALVIAAACHAPAGDAELRSPSVSEGWAPVALETLAKRTWVLRAWDRDEAAQDQPRVTLQYADGRFAGRSGCNRYTGTVTAGAVPGSITVGAIAGTRMMCPEPAHGIESRFLAVLAKAQALQMRAGRLGLVYAGPHGTALLIFDETRAVAN